MPMSQTPLPFFRPLSLGSGPKRRSDSPADWRSSDPDPPCRWRWTRSCRPSWGAPARTDSGPDSRPDSQPALKPVARLKVPTS